jgi:tetratricopeptide (TPR) repeat protein
MRKRVLVATMALTALAAFGQQQPAGQPPKAATGDMKPKSKEEAQAIDKINKAKTDDDKIAAVDAFVTGFPNSDFKSMELMIAAEAADRKTDYVHAVSYGESAIQSDPKSFYAMLLVAGELAQHTQKYDLDKEEKLTKAEKYVNDAIAVIPNAIKPHSGVSDSDWAAFKKDQTGTAHKDLGLIAEKRTKWDVAAMEYQSAFDIDPTDQVTGARLANAYNEVGKFTEALAAANKVLKMENLNPTVKAFADQQQQRAQKGLSAKK